MIVLEELGQTKGTRQRPRIQLRLPETRPSILDPWLETEPWIDCCCYGDTLALFVHNHPIALIPGSPLECYSLCTRLNQLRHRTPRQ